jgi:xylulokinase
MAGPCCLAIDLGTTALKAAAVDATGQVLTLVSLPIDTYFVDDGVEQHAEQWWSQLVAAVREIIVTVPVQSIEMITCTAQYMSLVPVGPDGVPVGPVLMWMDERAVPYADRFANKELKRLWRQRHGLRPFGSDGLSRMLFVQAEQSEIYHAAARFVEPVDALTARLVGHVTANQNSAFPLLLSDNRQLGMTDYDAQLIEMAGVDRRKLPEIVPVGQTVGTLCGGAASELGLLPSTQVVSGVIDSATSAIGTRAVTPNQCGVVIGTTAVVVAHTESLLIDPARALMTAPSGLPDRYVLLAENGVGGKAIEQVANLLNLTIGDLFGLADSAPPGCHGAGFLPWLVGSMAPRPNPGLRGGFVGLSLSTSVPDLARSALEGVAVNIGWLVSEVEEFLTQKFSSLSFGGGVAASPLVGQILADVCQLPVSRVGEPRATNARAGALLAFAYRGDIPFEGIAKRVPIAATHEPRPEFADVYMAARERLIRAQQHL